MAVGRSAALALALVAGASAAGSWVAAVGLPDLGIVAAAETGIALERLALVPSPGARAWPTVVAAFLDAVDVVLVRSPPRLPAAQARRLAARARERGAVLVPLGPWSEPADLRLAVTASDWLGLGQGHGHLRARKAEVTIAGRGAATRERRFLLWLPSPDGTITLLNRTPGLGRGAQPVWPSPGTGMPRRGRTGHRSPMRGDRRCPAWWWSGAPTGRSWPPGRRRTA